MRESDENGRVVSVWVCPSCKTMLVSIAPKHVERHLEAPMCRARVCMATMVRLADEHEAPIIKGVASMIGPVFAEQCSVITTVKGF